MLAQDANVDRHGDRSALSRGLVAGFFVLVLVLLVTEWPLISRLDDEYPILGCVAFWTVGILSYRQDAKRHDLSWAVLSQILAVASLIALAVFGFTRRSWPNFLIAVPLVWLHIQLTRRWWARPGAWW